jgi:hypothetical protein
MLKTDSVVRCIRTVYRCLLRATSTAREWVLRLAPGGIFFVRHNNTCIKRSPRIMSTPGDHTQEPNMEGQETVVLIAAEPRVEDKKVEDDPVVEPVVSGLSAIGLEPATVVNPDVVPYVCRRFLALCGSGRITCTVVRFVSIIILSCHGAAWNLWERFAYN